MDTRSNAKSATLVTADLVGRQPWVVQLAAAAAAAWTPPPRQPLDTDSGPGPPRRKKRRLEGAGDVEEDEMNENLSRTRAATKINAAAAAADDGDSPMQGATLAALSGPTSSKEDVFRALMKRTADDRIWLTTQLQQSVDDESSPSAAAAVAPIAMTDSPAGAAAAAPLALAGCSMLDVLERDCASQFYISHFLELAELAHLSATCRSWRRWMQQPPANLLASIQTHSEQREVSLSTVGLVGLSCTQLRQYATKLTAWSLGHPDRSATIGGDDDVVRRLGSNQLLAALPAFPRLHSLTLFISANTIDSSIVRYAFQALGPTLVDLSLEVSSDHPPEALLATFSAHVALLSNLRHLKVVGWAVRDSAEKFSCGGLAQLPRLESFVLRDRDISAYEGGHFGEGEYINGDFQCTVPQTRELARCRGIRQLECGSWTAVRNFDDDGEPPLDEEAEAALAEDEQRNIFAAFVRSIIQCQPHTSSADASSSSSQAVTTSEYLASLPLSSIDLATTTICRAAMSHLGKLTSLRRLEPHYWRHDLTLLHWAALAEFKQLTHFRMHPAVSWTQLELQVDGDESGEPEPPPQRQLKARTEDFLPSLLQCARLESLRLHGPLSLSNEQLALIVAAFPQLRVLRLVGVEVESVAPLSAAHSLRQLWLIRCSSSAGAHDICGSSIPTLPQLSQLRFVEQMPLRAARVARLNKALLQRMPQLHIENQEPNASDL